MKLALFTIALLVCAGVASAQLIAPPEPIFKLYAAANGIWYDGDPTLPPDFEIGATGRASLSPHISGVGSLYYGFDNSYLRGSAGARITATDVNDPNFSIGVGIQYYFSSENDIRPQEWAPDVAIGWKPWPQTMRRLIVGALGTYGLDSKKALLLAGVRYELGNF
jgi:hypothetical protein